MEKRENMLEINDLLDLEQTIAKDFFTGLTYPWEVFDGLEDKIIELGKTLPKDKFNQIDENIWVAKSAKVAPTACLNGPLIIDEDAEIRHCAFIRGTAIVGKGSVVGNSTELKSSILFNSVQTPHYNYVGNSILSYKSHMGAGSITSNLKSDKSLVTIKTQGGKIETGLKKLGAILGSYVEVGCNTVMNPGTVIGKNTNIYPLSMVRGYVPENSIYKKSGEIVEKEEK
jgi:NDP-sugar pyrophosphorylase family protein